MWAVWWVWMIGGLVLAILEVLMPAQIFLGFAVGAGLTGLAILVGLPVDGAPGMVALVFAVASLIAWLVLRRVMGVRSGQVKSFDHDIND